MFRDVIKTPLGALLRSTKCNGKGSAVRAARQLPERGTAASIPGLSIVAKRLVAAGDQRELAGRVRLGQALSELARELAASRREIAVLKRENAALRSKLDAAGAA